MNSSGTSLEDLSRVARTATTELTPAARRIARPRDGFYVRSGKRLLDLLVTVPLLVLLAPIIVLAAVAVVSTSGWPAFYRARRIGRDGREFSMWKIRTMIQNADEVLARWRLTQPQLVQIYERDFKLKNDPRVTLLGRFLRQSSLDELPQLWNVVIGEMSLVGPRPYMRSELESFPATAVSITVLRPGLTGPWQVQGRNALEPRSRMQMDEQYAQHYSLKADVKYLLRTTLVVLRRDGL